MKALLPLTLLATSALVLSFRQPSSPLPATPAGSSLEAASYSIDAGHSSVVFRCKHLGIAQFYGRFNQVSGEVQYDEANPAGSSILVVIPADSIDSNSEGRDRHLRSNDFLSVKEYPEISFESTKVRAKDGGLEVTGDLTFHGETKQVVARAEVIGAGESPFNDYRLGLEARFEFDMRDFGVAFVEKSPGAVGPEVQITVSLECVRQ